MMVSHNFLLVSWGSSGNLNPLLTAGRQLRQRGHRVRVMADPAMRHEVAAARFDFATWRRAPTGQAADPTDFHDIGDWLRRAVSDPAADYAADVRDEIGNASTDAVLTNDLLFGAVLGAEAAGARQDVLCRVRHQHRPNDRAEYRSGAFDARRMAGGLLGADRRRMHFAGGDARPCRDRTH
jgi:hypothetical protein